MTHDVRAGELAYCDVLDAVEHLHCDLESAGLVLRQVDLRDVAGDDDLGAEADTRQEHLHLLPGRVLRLVKNNEAVVQRAAAHVCKRRDLDIAALKVFLICVRSEHIKQCIVQRAQIRVHLALQVARQKAEALTGFNGRTRQNDAVLILASATPAVGDYYRASQGKTELLEMKNRVNRKSMPSVVTVDMREELEAGNRSVLSRKLLEEIKKNVENKEQSILFLNRRGYSTFVSCRNCGFAAKCPNCSISLTYHKYSDMLKCHYCGYERKNYTVCPECGSKYIRFFGGGTQKVEEEIQNLIPGITTVRMDVDTTSKVNSHEKILEKFEKEKIDVLVGTQMVTKGAVGNHRKVVPESIANIKKVLYNVENSICNLLIG